MREPCSERNLILIDGIARCAFCGGEPHREVEVVKGDARSGVVAGLIYLALLAFATGAAIWSSTN